VSWTGSVGPFVGATAAAAAPNGTAYVALAGTQITAIDPNGRVSVVAGSTAPGFGGDGHRGVEARFNGIRAMAVARDGTIFVADAGNNRIRTISTRRIVATFAGTGTPGAAGDGGKATRAELSAPGGVSVTPDGTILVADTGNNRIRVIDRGGVIHPYLGTGVPGYAGDAPNGTTCARMPEVRFDRPTYVVGDGVALVIVDAGNHAVRIAQTVIDTSNPPTLTRCPQVISATGVVVNAVGAATSVSGVLVADAGQHTILEVVQGGGVRAWGPITMGPLGQYGPIASDGHADVFAVDQTTNAVHFIRESVGCS
jgi:hypothetical protein